MNGKSGGDCGTDMSMFAQLRGLVLGWLLTKIEMSCLKIEIEFDPYQGSWGLCERPIIKVINRWVARVCRFTNQGFLGMFLGILEVSHTEGWSRWAWMIGTTVLLNGGGDG